MAEVGTYALVDENGVVVNTIMWDGDLNNWTPPEGLTGIEYTEGDGPVSIGWTWDGESFAPPEPEEPQGE